MPRLTKAQKGWLENVYNKSFSQSQDNRFALRVAANLYNQSKLNPSFKSADGSMVGIAALPSDIQNVDPQNTEDSLDYIIEQSLQTYLDNAGDVNALIVNSKPEDIRQLEREFDAELFGNNSKFSEMDSVKNRFNQSLRDDDISSLSNVLDEMIKGRVINRNKVINNDI